MIQQSVMSHRAKNLSSHAEFQEGSEGAAPVVPQTVLHPGIVQKKPEEPSSDSLTPSPLDSLRPMPVSGPSLRSGDASLSHEMSSFQFRSCRVLIMLQSDLSV
jgi:hypothetical protein